MLTSIQCKNAPTGEHPAGHGLYLKVIASGARSWFFRFQINGKRRKMGLGTLDDLSLADARAEAAQLGKLVRQGIDPLEQKQAAKVEQARVEEVAKVKAVSFNEAATLYVDSQESGWKNAKHVAQWRSTLKTYGKPFGRKPVGEVTIADVEKALRQIWLDKPETATRVLDRIVLVMRFARLKGWSDTIVSEWTADLRQMLPAQPKKDKRVRHHPALPYDQITGFLSELRTLPGTAARALEFLILCASRSGEVRLARWSEIDLQTESWAIPASRMKAGTPHRVPLSKAAVALLQTLGEGKPDQLIFPGMKDGQPLSDMTLTAVIRRRNATEVKWKDDQGEPIVVHGFRSTFRDWAAETTPFPSSVVEMALAHTISNKVEAAYRRGDLFEKRRELMQAWADYAERTPGQVIDFPARSAA